MPKSKKTKKPALAETTTTLVCSFCREPSSDKVKLLAGPKCFICTGCLDLCNEILEDTATTERGYKTRAIIQAPYGKGTIRVLARDQNASADHLYRPVVLDAIAQGGNRVTIELTLTGARAVMDALSAAIRLHQSV